MLRTHFYNSKLGDRATGYSQQLNRIVSISYKAKVSVLADFYKQIKNEYARIFMQKILTDPKRRNYDKTNDLDAVDVLYLIMEEFNTMNDENCRKDLWLILEEQLADMRKGNCAQGRAIRLFQVLVAFSDSVPTVPTVPTVATVLPVPTVSTVPTVPTISIDTGVLTVSIDPSESTVSMGPSGLS
jgi:hypothetical protein